MNHDVNDSNEDYCKSVGHIALFLKFIRPKKEIDQLAIRQLCYQMFADKLTVSPSKITKPISITFEEFKKWLHTPSPDNGDVITYDNIKGSGRVISIVRLVELKQIRSGVTLHEDGRLVHSDEMLPLEGHRQSTEDETKLILKALSRSGLEWNQEYSKATEKYVPKSGNYVRVTSPKEGSCVGVYSETRDGYVYMSCVKDLEGQILYGLNVCLGEDYNLKFAPLNELERLEFTVALNDVGKDWNHYNKRIEDVDLRSKKGKPYYYINDKFVLLRVHESLSTMDNKRYSAGNYFKTKEDGTEVLERILYAIKAFHAGPNLGYILESGK